MKIGIYEKAINNKFSWEDKIIIAQEAGYDFIEFSIDESDMRLERLDWSEKEISDLRKLLIKHNFAFNSMTLSAHRKYPFGSIDPKIRKRACEIMEKSIILAKKLGIYNIQLAGYDVYYEESNEQTIKYFEQNLQKACDLAMKHSIMLSFEIMDTPFMGTITKSLHYINKINSPWLNIYPDIGNLYQWAKDDFEKEIIKGKDKIIACHFKDTKPGIFREVPWGEGTVNFVRVFQALDQIKFKGPWLIEMWSENKNNETKQENILKIKEAIDFFNQKRDEAK